MFWVSSFTGMTLDPAGWPYHFIITRTSPTTDWVLPGAPMPFVFCLGNFSVSISGNLVTIDHVTILTFQEVSRHGVGCDFDVRC